MSARDPRLFAFAFYLMAGIVIGQLLMGAQAYFEGIPPMHLMHYLTVYLVIGGGVGAATGVSVVLLATWSGRGEQKR